MRRHLRPVFSWALIAHPDGFERGQKVLLGDGSMVKVVKIQGDKIWVRRVWWLWPNWLRRKK